MTLTIILSLLFFLGYMILRSHGQALAFLALGAGYQILTYLVPAAESDTVDFDTFVVVCFSSIAGYIAWRMGRKYLEEGLFAKHRIGIFAGVALNLVIAVFILWQTGTLSFGAPI